MNKCDNCKLRQYMAITFDLHWMCEDDCPFGCPVEAPTIIPASEEGELQKLERSISGFYERHEAEEGE